MQWLGERIGIVEYWNNGMLGLEGTIISILISFVRVIY
jgi:hypothetical protein